MQIFYGYQLFITVLIKKNSHDLQRHISHEKNNSKIWITEGNTSYEANKTITLSFMIYNLLAWTEANQIHIHWGHAHID